MGILDVNHKGVGREKRNNSIEEEKEAWTCVAEKIQG